MLRPENSLTIGSDAEFFLMTRYGGIIPATAFNTPGTKEMPLPLRGGTFHRDNLSVEIQPEPGTTPGQFSENAIQVRQQLAGMYDSMSLDLYPIACVHFEDDMVDLPEAHEIGCEPDYCAYTGTKQESTTAEVMGNYRVSSGHIHIGGIADMSTAQRRDTICHLDMLEALLLTLEDIDSDSLGHLRRRYYGQAGRYRLKPYGVEWRTPSSNNWHSYVHNGQAGRLFSAVYASVALTDAGVRVQDLVSPAVLTGARECIDTGQYTGVVDYARQVRDQYSQNDTVTRAVTEAEARFDRLPGIYSI